ncbi:MAG: guaA 1 [Gammaproteobacteria bacterium]|jgi:GMP synthase (glutamine-hydrolysing)|nr:guaA 1 [Gammaproteobacteria bacterium]
MTDIHAQRILILDFGSQYTQLIGRRIRDIGVYCEIHPFYMPDEKIKAFHPNGIILSGGPDSVIESDAVRAPEIVFQLNCPVLGICYGMQTMAIQLGGQVTQGTHREFGYAQIKLRDSSFLLEGMEDHIADDATLLMDVWMSHGDHVSALPPHFSLIASSESCEIIGMADAKRHFYGLQFHPEVSHTRKGLQILERFILDICRCKRSWTTQTIIEESLKDIQDKIGKDSVILGLSGGVDSSVVAALLHRAINSQLVCVFVDTGLLRLNEAQEVQALFAKHMGIRLITINAAERFFAALKGVTDPEEKRKIIGKLFVAIFEEEAKKLPDAKWLAQGTIYPDVIESAGTGIGKCVIKSHHNVGGLPEKMHLKLLEPLRELFKDEVIKMGLELGLPQDSVYRHAFPGPGLAVRILGEVKKEFVETLQRADAILIEELYKNELYYKVSQAFMVFLPVKSVGVLGDARHYDHVVAIRIVETVDFMTAHCARLPHEFLEKISNRIINEVPGISRVVYDLSSKPPATIEWE